ncbi:MAG: hypothetical protein ACLP4W_04115 [Mycobacterium sp.]|uniref:hypothetical protein n=1 Tax=Mycobacterium sp. TaxID=1785 RepID=UPI003F9C4B90
MKTTRIAAIGVASAAAMIGFPATACADPAVNLPVTDDIRAELVQAGAVLTGRPASEFTGLVPGRTYYAYDPNTDSHWAAAALVASRASFQAGVNLQDQNSYMLFKKAAGGTWIPYADGYGGMRGAHCPVQIPTAVLNVWQWPAGGCYPPS